VFPLTGKVYENPKWYKTWLSAVLVLLIGVVACRKFLQELSWMPLLGFLVFGQIFALLLAHQADFLWYTSYTLWQRLSTVMLVGLDAMLVVLLLYYGYSLWVKKTGEERFASWLYQLYLLVGAYALFKTICLAVNGRYISFPILTASIAVLGVLGLVLIRYIHERQWSLQIMDVRITRHPQERWLGIGLFLSGFALIAGETTAFLQSRDLILAYPGFGERLFLSLRFTLTNLQLMQWLVCVGILALPWMAYRHKTAV
jgi:hypothetical protein